MNAWSKLGYTLLACLSFSASAAGTATVTVVPPTTNTDGTTIPATGESALESYRAEYGMCASGTFSTKTGEQSVEAPTTSITFDELPPGVWCFRAYSKNGFGNESGPSNTVSKTILAASPRPPTLTISAVTVYTVIKQVNKFVMLPVGSAPAGTACDPDQHVNGYNVVPRAAVSFSGNVKPDVVVAKCS